ncbi:MAG: hypothetical protein FJW36_22290 [Acidobacteria bacterium]|nr:hypothetical protein [Acidobacteriota bacterium]
MKRPILSILSLVIPVIASAVGYYGVKNVKGATNLGEAIGGFLAWVIVVVLAGIVGEVLAIAGLIRGERLVWLGVLVNAALVFWVI